MFIVTAQIVKPVNRDDLPRIPAVEGMKNGSLLGVEPKGTGVSGPSGFIINGPSGTNVTPQPAAPAKTGTETAPASSGSNGVVKASLPEVSVALPVTTPADKPKQ